jgi:hypothetical protein
VEPVERVDVAEAKGVAKAQDAEVEEPLLNEWRPE